MLETLSHFFKPEVQNAGEDLVLRGSVFLKIGSDTQIDASVRGSTPVQVSFRSDSISSPEFSVDCSCKASKKGTLCKHIWATLLVASKKSPDFFEEKTSLVKTDLFAAAANAKSSAYAAAKSPEAVQREAAFKEKQADYRKQAYQKQKERAKEMKASRASADAGGTSGRSNAAAGTSRGSSSSASASKSKFAKAVPDEAKPALAYFEANGFALSLPIDEAALNSAKRILSRVFHPDKGGSQDEMLELLKYSNVLLKHR